MWTMPFTVVATSSADHGEARLQLAKKVNAYSAKLETEGVPSHAIRVVHSSLLNPLTQETTFMADVHVSRPANKLVPVDSPE